MKKTILLTLALISVSMVSLNAQCFNDGSVGVHYAQKGETLYKIARNNNLSVTELCQMNGISTKSTLSICQKLKVANITSKSASTAQAPASYKQITSRSTGATFKPRATNTVKNVGFSYAQRLTKSKGTHIAEAGETLAEIAKYYGYTTERLAEMNSFSKNLRVEKGMLIIVNDCYFQNGFSASEPKSYEVITENPVITAKGEEVVITKPAPVKVESTKPEPVKVEPIKVVAAESIAEEVVLEEKPAAKPTPSHTMNMYMESEEMEMIDEINLVRSNPTAYAQHIEDYIDNKIKKGLGFATEATARELIAELKQTPALSILKPTKCIYEAAKNHGIDRLNAGSTDHQGTDKSWPWDRVTRSCPTMTDGNENLVGGPSSIREAVIILLIDEGIANRGHRKTMLQADWEYVACYKIGQVGSMPNNWVQKYGK